MTAEKLVVLPPPRCIRCITTMIGTSFSPPHPLARCFFSARTLLGVQFVSVFAFFLHVLQSFPGVLGQYRHERRGTNSSSFTHFRPFTVKAVPSFTQFRSQKPSASLGVSCSSSLARPVYLRSAQPRCRLRMLRRGGPRTPAIHAAFEARCTVCRASVLRAAPRQSPCTRVRLCQ